MFIKFKKYFLFQLIMYICNSTKLLTMEKQKVGRKTIPESDRLKLVSAYLKDNEKKAILKVHGSLTNAVRTLILPTLKIS